jgi:hypothetical protein
MSSYRQQVLSYCVAIFMAFLLCACDLSGGPANPAPFKATTTALVPLGRPASAITPNSPGQAASSPKPGHSASKSSSITVTPSSSSQPSTSTPPALAIQPSQLTPDPLDVPRPQPTADLGGLGVGAGRIYYDCESPIAGQLFFRRNCWYTELIDGTSIGVGAGSGRWPHSAGAFGFGLILVDGCPGDYENGAYTRYYDSVSYYELPRSAMGLPTPTIYPRGLPPNEWAQVVGVDGERVHLVSQDGKEFVFDLATCHWVVPPIPTETAPPPTFTPTPPSPTEMVPVPISRVPGTAVPTPMPPATATPHYAGTGIIVQGPFPPAQSETFRYRNYWYEIKGSERFTVYAGVEGSKGSRLQGMIKVTLTTADGRRELSTPVFYRTPTQSGYVQVVGADGETLHLRTWNGTNFAFDLPSRKWLKP